MNRILIVDDKPENLYYLKALLEGHGWLVDEARHGAEALVKARLNTPLIVVSDLLMPVMDGYTLLRHWKTDSNLSSIPFVVYTATYTEPEDERLALSLGADAFILKPSEPEHFLKALAEALERREAPKTPSAPMDSEDAGPLLNYSRTLIRKLEEKSLQLEKANEALLKDLQQRRNVEEALRQSEERFQLAVQGSTAGIWDWDIRSGTCYLSPRYHEMLDYSTEELAHRVEAFYAIVHPDDRAMVEKALHDHFSKDRKPYHVEFRMRSKSGTYRWFRATGQAVYDGSGTAYRMVGSTLDITEQKASEIRLMQALKEAEQFREALDHVPAHIYMKDLDSRYLYANRHTLQLFGCEASELRGKGDWDFFPPTAAHHLREIDLRVFAGEQTAEEVTVNAPNGDTTVFWEIKTPLYEDPTHQKICGLLGISTDITSKKQMERQLLRSQRLESIGTLAGGIAHDLNNVLAPILMSIDLLKIGESDSTRQAILNTIESSAKRGAEMISQVLSFARGVETRKLAVDVRKAIEEITMMVNETFLKNISIQSSVEDSVGEVAGDSTQLNQVLLNLCVNARDAMPKGGTLKISARKILIDEHSSDKTIDTKPGPHVLIEVEDTGCGMPPEVVDRIFEPFFTTKDFGKGTGLGLSTTLAIVRSHGGFVRVYSELGRGTCFRVYLPASEGSPFSTTSPSTKDELRGHGEYILVVDDEEAVREMSRQILEACGYHAMVASDGKEAMEMHEKFRDRLAAVVMDLSMPGLSGLSTIQALQTKNPKLKIIAASGLTTNGHAETLEKTGVSAFLNKPYSSSTLLQTLQNVLAS